MGAFLLGLLVLALLLLGAQRFTKANPATLARRARRTGGVALIGVAAVLLVRGMIGYAASLATLGFGLLTGAGRIGRGAGDGQTSRIVTDHLDMELDHASGAISGRVLKGIFANRRIENLKPAELALLWQDCRFVEPKSAALIEAYLDRAHPTWRDDMARGEAKMASGPDGRMDRDEAMQILGVKPGASEEDIRSAHRALMLKLHPDRGGSTYLAAKVNEAKDVLLG